MSLHEKSQIVYWIKFCIASVGSWVDPTLFGT